MSAMRRFELLRHQDISGVSGTGPVAEGVQFDDETVVMRWHGDHVSTVIWRNMQDAMFVHGHNGATEIVWVD